MPLLDVINVVYGAGQEARPILSGLFLSMAHGLSPEEAVAVIVKGILR